MSDKFDLTPVDHDPFEAMGVIPGLIGKPNALQAAPTSLQGNIAGLGLPAGVLAKYAGEQVQGLYSMATLPGDTYLGLADPSQDSPEGFGRVFGMAMGLAGGPLAGKGGGARMGFGGKVPETTAKLSIDDPNWLASLEKELHDLINAPAKPSAPQTTPFKSYEDTFQKLQNLGYPEAEAKFAAGIAHAEHDLGPLSGHGEAEPLSAQYGSATSWGMKQALKDAFDLHGIPYLPEPKVAPAQPSYTAPAKPLDHSYWGNEVLSAIHDGLPPDQAVAHVKDLAPDSSHAAIDAAAREYVPHAVDMMKHLSADEITKTLPEHLAPDSSWQSALPGVKKFLGIEEPKPSHSLTPVEHDPFAGTVPPVDMAALYGGLSMDPAARMERARELGFNPDLTLFHGRGSGPFQGLEFRDPALKSERAIFATDDPAIAETYAGLPMGTQRPEVMPMLARMQNPKVIDWGMRDYHPGYMRNALETARAQGHDSAIIQGIMDQGSGSPQTQYAIFDPRNLRSKFAAFNPAYRDSANLLSTRGGPFALTPVDHDPWEQR